MLFVALGAILAVSLGMAWRLKLKIDLRIAHGQSDIYLDLFFFYSLIKIPLHLQLLYRHGERLQLIRLKKDNSRKLLFPKISKRKSIASQLIKKLAFKHYESWIKLKSADCFLHLGADNAYNTVMLCALFKNSFETLLHALFFDDDPHISCAVKPNFERPQFILNLEGIIHLHHVKIILVTVKEFAILKSNNTAKGDSK